MKRFFYILTPLLFLACRKDVTLDLPDYQQKVVVEASIETGSPATVFLSYSVPYFGEFDYTNPQKSFIKGALVTLTDGTVTDTLRELYPGIGYFYVGTKIVGQQGRSYLLKVKVGEKTFDVRTTILSPPPPKFDTLYFSTVSDSLGYLSQSFNEPVGSGDCYRWLSKRLHRDQFFAAPFNSVFDDKFIDGTKINFTYNRGRQPDVFQQGEDKDRGYYKVGDTVVVKMCRIGRTEYDFWLTYYQNKSSNGNPFSAPANIKSMFNDYENVFGAFTGYSPTFDTIIISYE